MDTVNEPVPKTRTTAAAPNGASAREHNNRGALLHLDGDLDGAQAEYQAALEADPRNATALNNLGFLLAQQGQFEQAISYYRRAIEVDPGKSMAFANLGNAHAAQGDLDT